MNKYFVMFIKDIIENDDYYKDIRKFAEEKNITIDTATYDICMAYYDVIRECSPYYFVDAVNDYLEGLYETEDTRLKEINTMSGIIVSMYKCNFLADYPNNF